MSVKAPPRQPQPHPAPSGERPLIPIPKKWKTPAIITGPILATLAILGMYLGIKAAYGGFGHYYQLNMTLPRATQMLQIGSDVRMRGVVVGKVSTIKLAHRQVEFTLQMKKDYRVPTSAEAFVTLKTLLGAKFVDLRFDHYGAPFLSNGARIRESHVGPELEDALADGVDVLQAIRPEDLATVVSTLAQAAAGHGADVARGLKANSDLSQLFASTLSPQLKALHDFNVIFGALKDKGVDLNNLADAVNQGVPVYDSPQAQRDLRAALEAVVPFANNLADLLLINRADWDRMISSGDTVLGTVAAHSAGLQRLVYGLYQYVFKLSPPTFNNVGDGSGSAGFAAIIGGGGPPTLPTEICDALRKISPDLANATPLCGGA
jgi:phospholipid/cholesterol/gamma-HCH transport system substrate-binding protein